MGIGGNAVTELNDELQAWLREQLDNAVKGLINIDAFDYAVIEVKPTWVLPSRLLVGKARDQGDPVAFQWFICGEVPLDYIPASAANTPREAIRYFAMKWQLDSENRDVNQAKEMVEHAESLYALANDDRFWQ